ncbi:MAG: hypothetical protein WCI48_10265 [Bacteroidota bacterium]|jgi:Ca2+-binding RTX toxin-like protein
MKKLILLSIAGFMALSVNAQVDKTKLSLEVSKTNDHNVKLLSSYTWKRTIDGFSEGNQVVSILSSVTMSPDGKPLNQVIEKSGGSQKKPSKKQAEAAEYIKNAVELVSKYIFMSTGQMVDLFNKGTLSMLNDNLNAEAFNFIAKGDHIKYTYDKKSLQCKAQDILTLMNGDQVKATVSFKFVDDVNTVDKVVLDLPAKKIKVNMTNTDFAKKL